LIFFWAKSVGLVRGFGPSGLDGGPIGDDVGPQPSWPRARAAIRPMRRAAWDFASNISHRTEPQSGPLASTAPSFKNGERNGRAPRCGFRANAPPSFAGIDNHRGTVLGGQAMKWPSCKRRQTKKIPLQAAPSQLSQLPCQGRSDESSFGFDNTVKPHKGAPAIQSAPPPATPAGGPSPQIRKGERP